MAKVLYAKDSRRWRENDIGPGADRGSGPGWPAEVPTWYQEARKRNQGKHNTNPEAQKLKNGLQWSLVVVLVIGLGLLAIICGRIVMQVKTEIQKEAVLAREVSKEQRTLHHLRGQVSRCKILLRLDSAALSHSVHLLSANTSPKTSRPCPGKLRAYLRLKASSGNSGQAAQKEAHLIANTIKRH